jgi:D-alanyl-D-alanine dipeptidase
MSSPDVISPLRRDSFDLAQAFLALPMEQALADLQRRESHCSAELKHEHAAEMHHQLVEQLLLHSDDLVLSVSGCELTALQCCLVALYECIPIAKLLLEIKSQEYVREQRRKSTTETQSHREDLASRGFVYLHDVDPTIKEHLRYFTEENFVGRVITGYESPRAIVTRECAHALSRVQADLALDGYSLVIYDAYRPQRAVDSIVEWTHDHTDTCAKHKYYPSVDKEEIVPQGYVAPCSGHTRGSTLDLTIIKSTKRLRPGCTLTHRQLRNGDWIPFLDDGTVDMGTSFDFFGVASGHDSELVSDEHTQMRNYLRDKMRKHGFRHLPEEWWHYTLEDEPYEDTYFNFDIIH